MLLRALRWVSWLAIPLAMLLFAQWPLRELIQAHARLANDMAQIVFAVYAACAISAASLAREHLAAHSAALKPSLKKQKMQRYGLVACLLPWAVYMLWAASPMVWQSMIQLEKFPDTLNPGFFLIKAAAYLLVIGVLLHVVYSTVSTRHVDE